MKCSVELCATIMLTARQGVAPTHNVTLLQMLLLPSWHVNTDLHSKASIVWLKVTTVNAGHAKEGNQNNSLGHKPTVNISLH